MEGRDDIQKLIGKRRQKPEESSLVKSAVPAESVFERHHEYQESHLPRTSVQPLPSIEEASKADSAGQQVLSEFRSQPSRNFAEETPSADDSTESDAVSWLRRPSDAETTFLQRNGYIVPLSNEALAAIRVVLGREAALTMASIYASSPEFRKTLKEDREVLLQETKWKDPERKHLDEHDFGPKKDGDFVADFLDRLWSADLSFCRDQQEAIYQRTVLVAMINRHQLIYAGMEMSTELPESDLRFSVEAAWKCPSMPTRRFTKKANKNQVGQQIFTTLPKPDLCVSFRRNIIIDSDDWKLLLPETQQLICYEGIANDNSEASRAFGFFFVEAKRSRNEPNDEVALGQVLNDASQALHNMHEFFKEAGHTKTFFKRVRVFSATTSEKGVIIRVHWASELGENTETTVRRIVPDYPLRFEHQTYESFNGNHFIRLKVVEVFERVMIGYGVKQLLGLLKAAAAVVKKKASDASRNGNYEGVFNDYRYGQSGGPASRAPSKLRTPAVEGSQPAYSGFMPPPTTSRPIQEIHTSDPVEGISQAIPQSTSLSQDVTELQTSSFDSQSSEAFQRPRRKSTLIEQPENPAKRRKT